MTDQFAREASRRSVEADVRELRDDFRSFRTEVGKDIREFRSDFTKLAGDLAGSTGHAVVRGGQSTLQALEHGIESRPFTSVMLSFGFGFWLGSVLAVRRAR